MPLYKSPILEIYQTMTIVDNVTHKIMAEDIQYIFDDNEVVVLMHGNVSLGYDLIVTYRYASNDTTHRIHSEHFSIKPQILRVMCVKKRETSQMRLYMFMKEDCTVYKFNKKHAYFMRDRFAYFYGKSIATKYNWFIHDKYMPLLKDVPKKYMSAIQQRHYSFAYDIYIVVRM